MSCTVTLPAGAHVSGLGRTVEALHEALLADPRRCPVCAVVEDGLRRKVDDLFYDSVNDIATRDTIRAAGGFCRLHAHLVAQQTDALGSSLILGDVLANQVRALKADRFGTTGPGGLSRLFGRGAVTAGPRPPCLLCATERELEERAADGLLEALDDAAFVDLLRNSTGLCLPHLRIAHGRSADGPRWKRLRDVEIAVLERITDDLMALAKSFDYRCQGAPAGVDARIWRLALSITAGWTGDG